MLLTLLLFAVQLVLNLYATSVVTAVGFDAARLVAGADAGAGSARDETAARDLVSDLLGGYRDRGDLDLSFSYASTAGGPAPEVVRAHLVARHPTQLLPDVTFPFQTVDRTITVRLEELR